MTEEKPASIDSAEPVYLIHDSELDIEAIADFCAQSGITLLTWAEREQARIDARVLLYLGDERTRDLAPLALERGWAVGVLPHERARNVAVALGVRGDLQALVKHYLQAPVIEADALTCNDELVFNSVVIGRVLALRPYDINRPQTSRNMLRGALRGLSKLTLSPYRIITSKERDLNIAALGMVAVGQTQSRLMGRAFSNEIGIADGRLSLLVLAPRSVLSYLVFLLHLLLPGKFDLNRLPGSLSLVQTSRLHISAPKGTEYLVDGKPVHASEIELKIAARRLRLLPGPALKLDGRESKPVEKETVRLNDTPVDDGARALLGKSLPLFDHAAEDDYRELFVSLRDGAMVTPSYQMLMVLSVLLALLGLYANSAPVIIGAMILAPLMSPIISLSMGLARSDVALMAASGRTLGRGVLWGLGCAILLAWAMPLEIPTVEMKARMSPTLLDLLVAVVSGIAGAYASAKEKIAKSLAGVAIAVALIPPLSVAGIGLGWGDWDMARGAALLLITNLVGIALAGSVTFLVLGFAPFKRARAGLGVTLFLALLICLPLSLSFYHLVMRDRILEQVPRGEVELSGLVVTIGAADVKFGDPHVVRLTLSAAEPLTTAHVDAIKSIISARVGEPVEVEVQANLRR